MRGVVGAGVRAERDLSAEGVSRSDLVCEGRAPLPPGLSLEVSFHTLLPVFVEAGPAYLGVTLGQPSAVLLMLVHSALRVMTSVPLLTVWVIWKGSAKGHADTALGGWGHRSLPESLPAFTALALRWH